MEGGKLVSMAQALFVAAKEENKHLIAIHIRKAPSIQSQKWKATLTFVIARSLGERPEYRQWEFDMERKVPKG